MKLKRNAQQCLMPGCDNPAEVRGLCHNHNNQARRMIKAGNADEADLVKRGLMLEKQHRGKSFNESATIFKKGSKVRGRPPGKGKK